MKQNGTQTKCNESDYDENGSVHNLSVIVDQSEKKIYFKILANTKNDIPYFKLA